MIKTHKFTNDWKVVSDEAHNAHMNLYSGYAEKVNEIHNKLKNAPKDKANKNYSEYRGLKKELSLNLNGVILHELFFRNTGGEHNAPLDQFNALVNKDFGGYENWLKDLIATANSARGWAIAAYEQRTKCLQNILLDRHDEGLVSGMFPIVVLDVYEHAFVRDFGDDQNAYVQAAAKKLCFETIEKRVKSLEGHHGQKSN